MGHAGRILRVGSTDLGAFGNRTDFIIVDGSRVRGATSFLELTDDAILVSQDGVVFPHDSLDLDLFDERY